jgi:rhodanese-related sulfurtransferase
MNETVEFSVHHGAMVMFAVVFIERIRALHMAIVEVQLRHAEIARDRDIVLYCSCPNEVTSARVALQLHQKGISRVRPLLGGIDAWRERKYPTEMRAVGVASTVAANS